MIVFLGGGDGGVWMGEGVTDMCGHVYATTEA